MRISVHKEVTLICYAGDLAIVITGDTVEQVRSRGNDALEKVAVWMEENELEIAPQKTKTMSLTCRRKVANFKMRGHNIEDVRS